MTVDYVIKMLAVVMPPPKFTRVPVAGSKELKLIVREQQGTRLPSENSKLQNIG